MVEIEIIEGDITGVAADALVNAANNHLWMGAGVAGAIKKAGGNDIEEEAVSKGPILVGAVIETGAKVQVPLFIGEGDVIKVDVRTGKYMERISRA